MELTRQDMALAEEVITEACNGDRNFEAVIWRRWGATKGGVGFANGRTRARVRAAVIEWYRPEEPREPTYGGACG